MGKSQQTGWVSLRGRYWYGYFRETTLDPETDEDRTRKIPIRLGLKTQLTKLKAREALRAEIVKRNGQVPEGRVLKDSSIPFGRFVRNRYFPIRKGDWRPQTAVTKMDQIETDLIGKFGEYPMESLDRFVLQTHLNFLADRYCQDRVKQDRSYLKSIFDEAIEQEYLVKDPTRKLRIPKNLRQKNKRVLDWETLRAILATAPRRDRLLLAIDMTEALRPSELFALRWRSFDNQNTLKILETVYRGELRPYGKTVGSLTKVFLPDGLAAELQCWKSESGNVSPDDFIFPNADGGFLLVSNYRNRVLKPLAERLGIEKLNFQILRRTMATQAQNMGSVKDIQAHLRHARPDTTANEYMQALPASVQQMVGSVYLMLTKGGDERQPQEDAEKRSSADLPQNATNFWRPVSVSC